MSVNAKVLRGPREEWEVNSSLARTSRWGVTVCPSVGPCPQELRCVPTSNVSPPAVCPHQQCVPISNVSPSVMCSQQQHVPSSNVSPAAAGPVSPDHLLGVSWRSPRGAALPGPAQTGALWLCYANVPALHNLNSTSRKIKYVH